jgi:exodeoxyribonuclease-5
VNLASPTAKLTTVHRQALESDVLALATLLREGKVREFTKWGGDVTFSEIAYAKQAAAWKSQNPDRMLLTWTNKVRGNINLAYRRDLGFKKDLIHDGETLICTMNNHGKAIVNGELFTVDLVIDHEPLSKLMGRRVQKVFPKGRTDYFLMIPSVFDMRKKGKNGWWLSDKGLIDDASEDFVKGFWEPDSGLDLKEYKSLKQEWLENRVIGTWGYCLTVHKSQGSQWEDVAFVSCWAFRQEKEKTGRGPSADDRKRMLYTAVTRASERVHIFKLS